MRVINHFGMTVIYHFKRTVLAPALEVWACLIRLPAACHSLKRMTTCREPNGFITQVQILISKGWSYSFRRDNHLSYRKESWGCNIQLGTEVSNWLHQRLWKDHHLRLAERIPLYSRGAKGTNISALCWRCAECRWSGSGTIDLISGDFHFAVRRLNPGNNSLREIPIKETVALPSEQFYLTTELSNVVGISFIFVTSFSRYPCRRW